MYEFEYTVLTSVWSSTIEGALLLLRSSVLNLFGAPRVIISDTFFLMRLAGDSVIRRSGRDRGARAAVHSMYGAGRHRDLLPALLL